MAAVIQGISPPSATTCTAKQRAPGCALRPISYRWRMARSVRTARCKCVAAVKVNRRQAGHERSFERAFRLPLKQTLNRAGRARQFHALGGAACALNSWQEPLQQAL